ncbi:MAG: high-affinity nickel permease [Candidatus Omnitrophota bacterium]|jgi:hypothetical protein
MIATQQVKVNLETHKTLKKIAKLEGTTITKALCKSVEMLNTSIFMDRCNEAYAKAKKSKKYDDENSLWESTLLDGLG